MPSKNLLQAVQFILKRAHDDEVTATNETDSSELVKTYLEVAFYQLNSEFKWPYKTYPNFWEMPDVANLPTSFTVPSNCKNIVEVRYGIDGPSTEVNESNHTKILQYMPPVDFLHWVSNRNHDWANTVYVELDAVTLYAVPIRTNKDPSYWTSLDGNQTVILDSYKDSDVGTLEDQRVIFTAEYEPSFPSTDNGSFDFPSQYQPLLWEEAFKLYAISMGRDADAAQAERIARKMRVTLRNDKSLDSTPAIRYNPTRRGSR